MSQKKLINYKEVRLMRAFLFAALSLLFIACGGPPQEALDDAEKALLNANWSEDCAGETYRSAQRMLEEAKAESEAGNYDEAKRKADAAKRLAEQAAHDAEVNAEECERRKNAMNQIDQKIEEDRTPTVVETKDRGEFEVVYFDFNESILTTDSQEAIDKNAALLLDDQTLRVRIGGHTDERGSTEFNLALSQRRAQAVKRYLEAMGVEESRMVITPYGEEKPASYGSSEADHAKNRRADFEAL